MSLFRDLGRRVERFRNEIESTADDEAPFECEACDERLFSEIEACPSCGSERIVARD